MTKNIIMFDEPQCSSKECKICGQNSHGIHFGVTSCRACAAFFRRSIVLSKKYICRRANSKCRIDKSERYLCRLCRLEKCKLLGMTEENVQWNRDSISSTQKSVITANPGSKSKSRDGPPLFDVSETLQKINYIFENFKVPEDDKIYMSKTTLGKMDYALQAIRVDQKRNTLNFRTTMDMDEMIITWGDEMCRVANWMMHSEEFRKLESSEKFSVFKLVWMVWQRFERLTMSIEIFGKKAYDDKIIVISDDDAIHMNLLDVDVSKITDHSSDSIRLMFEPFCLKMFENIAKPLLEIEPTSMEVTYMLCQVFWHNGGRLLHDATLSASEKFIDIIANDLHFYYTKDRKITNYAGRLIRLMSVVNSLQRLQLERQKLFELAKLFDVFKVKLAEPEDLFEG